MRTLLTLFIAITCIVSCGGSDDPEPIDAAAADGPAQDSFAQVTAALAAALPDNAADVAGMTLIVFDRDDERVYEHTVGDFDPDRRVAIASASKLVSALVLMRLIDAGDLALNDTTGALLGWNGDQAAITLDQLGAFVSGLRADPLCTLQAGVTLEECVDTIALGTPSAAPGAQLDYGSSHLHVAARMAEVVTGQPWRDIAAEQLFVPLGLTSPELAYYTFPRSAVGTSNPLVAGGLRATANEYAPLLALLFHRGASEGQPLISAPAMERFRENRFTDASVAGSPYAATYFYRYGFGSWLECSGPVASCDVVSSAGAFGFTPWVDYQNEYYAILAMESPEAGAGSTFAVALQQQLKPLIVEALAE